jgi:cytochrome c peroxidase
VLRGALLIAGISVFAGCESDPPDDPSIPLLEKHHGLGDPRPDTSNKYIGNPAAIELGKKFYFDPDFSGKSTLADMLLRDMTTPGRAAKGERINVSCNSCHDVTKGGSDHTADPPGNVVSFGAGAYDVNGQQTINSAFYDIVYWNGRNDSLWSQIVAVVESHVSVNGSRMRVAWRIADKYKADYEAVFTDVGSEIPAEMDSVAAQQARLEADGTCVLENGTDCPAPYCAVNPEDQKCHPIYPFDARPGFADFGAIPHCGDNSGSDDLQQPYNDAWDCMQGSVAGLDAQQRATRIYVNFAKAIAAYEYTLISKDSPFDVWADGGFQPGALGASAERGARLFVGKAACAECHSGPLFSDSLFHDIGVPQLGTYVPTTAECPADGWCDCVSSDTTLPQNCLPIGARDGLRKLRANTFRRDSKWSDDLDCANHNQFHIMQSYVDAHPDECDGRVKYYASMAFDDANRGAWRTPSLRDVALTAPYMHNGMYTTLEDVVVHYNKGGIHGLGGESIGTIDPKIKELNLTPQEIDDLVAFLESLTGQVDPAVTEPPVVPAASAF